MLPRWHALPLRFVVFHYAQRLDALRSRSVGKPLPLLRPIVYNNFPWPDQPSDAARKSKPTAQTVLDARAQFPDASLADLYDPLTMPPVLVKAHQMLDAAVDVAYGKSFKNDAERVSFLLNYI